MQCTKNTQPDHKLLHNCQQKEQTLKQQELLEVNTITRVLLNIKVLEFLLQKVVEALERQEHTNKVTFFMKKVKTAHWVLDTFDTLKKFDQEDIVLLV